MIEYFSLDMTAEDLEQRFLSAFKDAVATKRLPRWRAGIYRLAYAVEYRASLIVEWARRND